MSVFHLNAYYSPLSYVLILLHELSCPAIFILFFCCYLLLLNELPPEFIILIVSVIVVIFLLFRKYGSGSLNFTSFFRLEVLNEEEWGGKVTVVSKDMREFRPDEKVPLKSHYV